MATIHRDVVDFKAGVQFGGKTFPSLATPGIYDHFMGATIDGVWGVNKGSDGAAVNFAINAAVNGNIRATTGAGAGASYAANGVQLHSALNYKANQGGLTFEMAIKPSAVATIAMFFGFTDQVAALEMPFTLGASDALTSNATDGVGFLFDTAADTDYIHLVGVKNDVDATKQALAVAPSTTSFQKYRVEVDASGNASFFIDGSRVGTVMADALTATVALTPVVAAFTRAAGSATIDIDYAIVHQNA